MDESDDDQQFSSVSESGGEFGYLQPVIARLPEFLSVSERQQVIDLLHSNSDVFSKHKIDR
jgi:hypothetical protein